MVAFNLKSLIGLCVILPAVMAMPEPQVRAHGGNGKKTKVCATVTQTLPVTLPPVTTTLPAVTITSVLTSLITLPAIP